MIREFVKGDPSLSTLDSETEQKVDRIEELLREQKRKLHRARQAELAFDQLFDQMSHDGDNPVVTSVCPKCQGEKNEKSNEEKSWEKEKQELQRKQADLLNQLAALRKEF